MDRKSTKCPWSYFLIRLLFKFVLKIFYGSIVVENSDLIPPDGQPCIVCANHSNSLTDALVLVTTIPSGKRSLLRLTAKATQFGKRTFTSWLIESAGTVPIKRRSDYSEDAKVDNTDVMSHLMDALELGDAVCLFPEGKSRYHPTMAPLKTGVARIVSDVLSRNRDDPNFTIYVQNCSITYTHRQHWRSDVLVTYHPPIRFTPKDNPELLKPIDYANILQLTENIRRQISQGTVDAPSWEIVRSAKCAANIYAPLGTMMSLGDYVRLVKAYINVFAVAHAPVSQGEKEESSLREEDDRIVRLCADLKVYQDQLARLGVKDDRIRRPLKPYTIAYRMTIRLTWSLFLLSISVPGLLLWFPVLLTTAYSVRNFKKTGPIWDTWDEIAQYKLIYGLMSGLCVWFGATVATLPLAGVTFFAIPLLMWMTLRWIEDAIAAFRAFFSLLRLLFAGSKTLAMLGETRKDLHERVKELSMKSMQLPENPEGYFSSSGGKHKGRVGSTVWESSTKYFSLRRRRKRDWNETLRLYDVVDFPQIGN
ncbi:hypothetical protein BJ322DRAFT_847987 [Thelephora terrestris]|uniref:Phospholipid/glycerol acyltransferase domain-containing protein n=1 Tax=Thelephora terrestris TaxID=56493 RepID=A0A9P6HEB4_9AGAM|nr:hypothetical protein BJ322DRAFT_847987 [Thelephora terrestris]